MKGEYQHTFICQGTDRNYVSEHRNLMQYRTDVYLQLIFAICNTTD